MISAISRIVWCSGESLDQERCSRCGCWQLSLLGWRSRCLVPPRRKRSGWRPAWVCCCWACWWLTFRACRNDRAKSIGSVDRIAMVLGAGLAALSSFGVLTAMVDRRHLDFARAWPLGVRLGHSGALMWCAGLLILSALVFWRFGVDRWLALATAVPCVGLWSIVRTK